MKNGRILIYLTLLICINLVFTGCTPKNLSNTKPYSYDYYNDYEYNYEDDSNSFNFSFKYPDTWSVEPMDPSSDFEDENKELPGEYGAELFKIDEENPKNSFKVYQSFSPLLNSDRQEDFKEEEYIIEDEEIGTIYSIEEDKEIIIYIVYNHDGEESFTNALLKLDKMFYKKNIDDIWSILGSVK